MKRNTRKQKPTLYLCGILIFCLFALAGCAKREVKNINSRGKNIICFGNSLTFGYGATPGEDYPSALAKMIKAPVINAGIDGDVTSEALKRIEQDVLGKDPLLVIIEFGGNDFLGKIPPEVTVNNIKQMIERIQAKGAMVAIVDISTGLFMKEYRAAFSRIARQKQAIFIPTILKGILTNPSMKSDFIHPNGAGYKLMAQRIQQAIAPVLEKNAILREPQK